MISEYEKTMGLLDDLNRRLVQWELSSLNCEMDSESGGSRMFYDGQQQAFLQCREAVVKIIEELSQ